MEYTKKVMQHFLHPKNVGKIKNPDGVGIVGNIVCGDVLKIFIKVGKKNGKEFIKDIKFQTLGCPAAIATSSVVTQLAKGKYIEDVIKIKNEDIVKKLGKLPPQKHHCSLLGEEALIEAVYNYLKKNKKKIPKDLEEKHKKFLDKKYEYNKKFKFKKD